jgi:hypothetical protein
VQFGEVAPFVDGVVVFGGAERALGLLLGPVKRAL